VYGCHKTNSKYAFDPYIHNVKIVEIKEILPANKFNHTVVMKKTLKYSYLHGYQ